MPLSPVAGPNVFSSTPSDLAALHQEWKIHWLNNSLGSHAGLNAKLRLYEAVPDMAESFDMLETIPPTERSGVVCQQPTRASAPSMSVEGESNSAVVLNSAPDSGMVSVDRLVRDGKMCCSGCVCGCLGGAALAVGHIAMSLHGALGS
jgi:hypothetical protein